MIVKRELMEQSRTEDSLVLWFPITLPRGNGRGIVLDGSRRPLTHCSWFTGCRVHIRGRKSYSRCWIVSSWGPHLLCFQVVGWGRVGGIEATAVHLTRANAGANSGFERWEWKKCSCQEMLLVGSWWWEREFEKERIPTNLYNIVERRRVIVLLAVYFLRILPSNLTSQKPPEVGTLEFRPCTMSYKYIHSHLESVATM